MLIKSVENSVNRHDVGVRNFKVCLHILFLTVFIISCRIYDFLCLPVITWKLLGGGDREANRMHITALWPNCYFMDFFFFFRAQKPVFSRFIYPYTLKKNYWTFKALLFDPNGNSIFYTLLLGWVVNYLTLH